jgi:serine/threonine protein kinase
MTHLKSLNHIPRSFGKYELTRRIETGSTCVVSEAVDKQTGKIYATKVMPFSKDIPTRFRQTIEREVRVLRRLKSDFLSELHDVVREHDFIYLVLENCKGGTLLSMIMEKRLSKQRDIQRIFGQIVAGVKYMHDHGISHGDIKAENIVFDCSGNAKLIDVGYCKEKRIGQDSDKSGTLNYAAPELLRTGQYRTDKADVWSLGILLYVMVTGTFPFLNDRPEVIRKTILSGTLKPNGRMKGECCELYDGMTSRKPEDRPTIHEIVSNPWVSGKRDLVLRF